MTSTRHCQLFSSIQNAVTSLWRNTGTSQSSSSTPLEPTTRAPSTHRDAFSLRRSMSSSRSTATSLQTALYAYPKSSAMYFHSNHSRNFSATSAESLNIHGEGSSYSPGRMQRNNHGYPTPASSVTYAHSNHSKTFSINSTQSFSHHSEASSHAAHRAQNQAYTYMPLQEPAPTHQRTHSKPFKLTIKTTDLQHILEKCRSPKSTKSQKNPEQFWPGSKPCSKSASMDRNKGNLSPTSMTSQSSSSSHNLYTPAYPPSAYSESRHDIYTIDEALSPIYSNKVNNDSLVKIVSSDPVKQMQYSVSKQVIVNPQQPIERPASALTQGRISVLDFYTPFLNTFEDIAEDKDECAAAMPSIAPHPGFNSSAESLFHYTAPNTSRDHLASNGKFTAPSNRELPVIPPRKGSLTSDISKQIPAIKESSFEESLSLDLMLSQEINALEKQLCDRQDFAATLKLAINMA